LAEAKACEEDLCQSIGESEQPVKEVLGVGQDPG
jgi:hypothetical protein